MAHKSRINLHVRKPSPTIPLGEEAWLLEFSTRQFYARRRLYLGSAQVTVGWVLCCWLTSQINYGYGRCPVQCSEGVHGVHGFKRLAEDGACLPPTTLLACNREPELSRKVRGPFSYRGTLKLQYTAKGIRVNGRRIGAV